MLCAWGARDTLWERDGLGEEGQEEAARLMGHSEGGSHKGEQAAEYLEQVL